jgi:response regulator of citrate/malate metabolism
MSSLRVAVLEDDATTAQVYQEYLRRIPGVECVALLHTQEEAGRYLATRRHRQQDPGIDLFLVDMNLPDGHGLDVVRGLRASGWQGGAIALTAAGERTVVRAAMASGVVDYLLKPFTFDDFAARVVGYRDLQRRLGGTGSIPDQDQLDRIFGSRAPGRSLELPKGLLAETLVQVREALEASEVALSARETAEVTGLSRVTARRYLEHLVDTGQAERSARHGTQGRPEVEYARTDAPRNRRRMS